MRQETAPSTSQRHGSKRVQSVRSEIKNVVLAVARHDCHLLRLLDDIITTDADGCNLATED